ncbi:CD209 antigen-like protein C [Carassius auratus]|uniref:CD209 antigen-like protein C n=1 Tax=Carassius auratus TaxID=7957 RepID=A0A6P6L840_CARAU|nr:CD209 antigen-like protein C [Carassius auratus]
MESGNFYVCRNVTNRSSPRTQIHCQDEGKSRKQRGSRCLVLITVSLALICVLLLVFIILQQTTITAERDLIKSYKSTVEEFNQTISSLQGKYNDVKIEKDQLQNNFNSLNVKLETRVNNLTSEKSQLQSNLDSLKRELESRITSLNDELGKEQSKKRNLCGPVCYFIANELKSWSDSRQYCRDHGADLVIINTEEKQRLISSLVSERVWIGLSDIENEGNMTWVDSSTVNQTFWFEGEPNNAGGNEDCIELMPSEPTLNWNDLPCSANRKGICEK